MGCCGKRVPSPSIEKAAPSMILGEKGLTKLVYTGDLNGKIRGKETCFWYEVSPQNKEKYVDKRDVSYLLGLGVFELWQQVPT